MEKMNLITPWKYGAADKNDSLLLLSTSSSSENNNNNPKEEEYLIPSNLRLFETKEIEKRRKEIDNEIILPKFDEIDEKSITINSTISTELPNCFYFDFSKKYLPIGFYDRLICLLVSKSEREPTLTNESLLISFGKDFFRVDEDIHNSRIIVSIKQDCNHKLVFNNIEQMTKKLNEDIMKNNLKYDEIVIVWNNNNNKCLKIDFNKAQNDILSNKDCVWDINHKNNLKVNEFKDKWMEILPITKGEEITIGFLSHYKEEAGVHARMYN